jgi:hypothetical protein
MDLHELPRKDGLTIRWPLIGLISVVTLGGACLLGWRWVQSKAEVFSLTLHLKTPQGSRELRVVGTDVTLEEQVKRADPVINTCTMDLMDFFDFRKLARATLSEPREKPRTAGTYVLMLGDGDPLDGNGNVDAEQAQVLTDFVVKRLHGCVDRSEKRIGF